MGWGTKVCSSHLSYVTKTAVTPNYVKNPKRIFSRTKGPIGLGLGMRNWDMSQIKFEKMIILGWP